MKKLFDYIVPKVDDAELYMKSDDVLSIEIKQGQIKAVDGKNVVGIALRMNKEGRAGTAVSTSTEDFSIVDRAITSSEYRQGDAFTFKYEQAEAVECYDEKLADLKPESMIAYAENIGRRLKNIHSDVTVMIHVERTISRVTMMNTAGLNDSYDKTLLDVKIMTMSEAGFVQNAFTTSKANLFELTDEQLKEIIDRHLISNTVHEVKTNRMPVVFSGKAMGALMTRLLAGINGEFITKGVSPLADKLNTQIGSTMLNISDNGQLKYGFATMKFDDEGMPTKATTIVENGILKNFLVGVSTEEKVKGSITGNVQKKTMFSKEIEDKPAIDSTNFIIHPGETSDEDLIKDIEYGIYVDIVMGTHTGNIPAGEYSLNVSIGYLIENGQLTGKVVDTMVSGNIYEDLLKIKAVGQQQELMHVVFYPMGYSPMVRFDDINVVGSK